MDEKEYRDDMDAVEETTDASPLAEVRTMLDTLEAGIADGTVTIEEAVAELKTALDGIGGKVPEVMGGLGADEAFPMPEPEDEE